MKVLFVILFLVSSTISYAQQRVAKEKVYTKVDKEASFMGSFASFMEQHLQYPKCAQDNEIYGTVILAFIVISNGTIGTIKVDNDSPQKDKCLAKAYIEMIKKSSGKWKDALLKGKRVASWHKQSILITPAEE